MKLQNIKADFSAGLVVYLVALPLCLGIALASGAPLLAGLISGIIAGTVVSWLSGSEVSVSGPAAGLTIIVAGGIASAGSYENFLFAVILAGGLQIGFGLLQAGTLGALFPNSVITGMLAAIGITIVLKQIPHGLGWDKDYEGNLNFFQFTDHENTISEIGNAVSSLHPGVFVVTLVALALLLIWNLDAVKNNRVLGIVPGPLLAVAAGVGLNEWFAHSFPYLTISAAEGHLVNLPAFGSVQEAVATLQFPNFSLSELPSTLSLAITIALVASIETLLCIEAGDKIDPYRRLSKPNKELVAQGVGNMICGAIGGLPITSVIVRTSANVYSGARTRFSVFVHGALLLLSLVLIPGLMNKIPLGALAAVLIFVGYKLARVDLFKKMYAQGTDQFVPFLVTIGVVIFTDLLTGVFSGLVASMFFAIKANNHQSIETHEEGDRLTVRFEKDQSFASKVRLKSILSEIPEGKTVLIDGTQASFIDRDIYDIVDNFKETARHKNIKLELKNMETVSVQLFSKAKPQSFESMQEASAPR